LILGGVKIDRPGKAISHWWFVWNGHRYRIAGIEKLTGITQKIIRDTLGNRKYALYVVYFSDGRVLPMQTVTMTKPFAPEGLSRRLRRMRLKAKKFIDLPITEDEYEYMKMRKAMHVADSEPIHITRKRYEDVQLHKMLLRMPRPKGMVDEAKEWQKPAW